MPETNPNPTKEEAHGEAVLLKRRAELNSQLSTNTLLDHIKDLASADADVLKGIYYGEFDESDHQHQAVANFSKVSALLALAVQKDPRIFDEMQADPNHPRLLDLYSAVLEMEDAINPEVYKMMLDAAVLKAELEMSMRENKAEFQQIKHNILEVSHQMAEVDLPTMSETHQYQLACGHLLTHAETALEIEVITALSKIAALDMLVDRIRTTD